MNSHPEGVLPPGVNPILEPAPTRCTSCIHLNTPCEISRLNPCIHGPFTCFSCLQCVNRDQLCEFLLGNHAHFLDNSETSTTEDSNELYLPQPSLRDSKRRFLCLL